MPYQVRWHTPGEIIFIEYNGMLKLKDFEEYNQDLIKLLDEGRYPVHVVADTANLQGVVPQAVDIKNVLSYVKHPSLGWVNICGANQIIRMLAVIVFQMTGTQLKMHDTVDEALIFVRDYEHTLKNYAQRRADDDQSSSE